MNVGQVEEKILDIKKDYQAISNISEEFSKFSFKEFCEMRMAVSSRIFGIKVNGIKTDCFCPLADMLNHRRPRQTQWFYSDELQAFVIQAIEDINVDDEIFDSYGKKCNSRFFLNYGFIVDKNDANEFPFVVEIDPETINYNIKSELIGSHNKFKKLRRTFRLLANYDEPVVKDYFSFLRFIKFGGKIDELIGVSTEVFHHLCFY